MSSQCFGRCRHGNPCPYCHMRSHRVGAGPGSFSNAPAANGAYWRRHEGGGHGHRRVCAWSHNGTPHAPGRRIHASPRGNVRAAARRARTSARERRRRVSQPQRRDPRNQERRRRTCAGLCHIRHRQGQTYLCASAVASLEIVSERYDLATCIADAVAEDRMNASNATVSFVHSRVALPSHSSSGQCRAKYPRSA